MTAVANPPSLPQQLNRPGWTYNSQGNVNSLNPDDVTRMFMPRRSAQRTNSTNSSSSTSSNSSSGTLSYQNTPQQQPNGASATPASDVGTLTGAGSRKKPQKSGPWAINNKTEPLSGLSTARGTPSILGANGVSAPSAMPPMHSVVPSQHQQLPVQQQNSARPAMPSNEESPVLCLLSMNGTFDRKTVNVPYYPDNLRIGRQTNAKTVPTSANGYFDSKVLSRQHAEVWADRNGKVWIRDVKSSNGTFVNGARLSPEGRESEPHELQTQDHLELGIDIVSEDQKTVVHHKVAAKVELAGFHGAANSLLDVNFGDLDPANGQMMLPPSGMLRGRSNSQGSMASNGRGAGSGPMNVGQQRPMNFWLTPVTTEQIVKKLNNEMRQARLQNSDLARTENFLDNLLSKKQFEEEEKPESPSKQTQLNGFSPKIDVKPRFTDPPAPPPQQPLPEKPDIVRLQSSESLLKRSSIDRPRSGPAISPVKQESTSQVIALLEALATAKNEIQSQGERMRSLEEMLQKEREARQIAEEHAERLVSESTGVLTNGVSEGESIVEDAREYLSEPMDGLAESEPTVTQDISSVAPTAKDVISPASSLQGRLEKMMAEMNEMKQQMETYRQRTQSAEVERDEGRKTLAEMVENIRADEQARPNSSVQRSGTPMASPKKSSADAESRGQEDMVQSDREGLPNGNTMVLQNMKELERHCTNTAHSSSGRHTLLHESAPYASMLGVVLFGMGVMAYMNGWRKLEN